MKIQKFVCSSRGKGFVLWLDSKNGGLKVMTWK
jgi:hypothetical protein